VKFCEKMLVFFGYGRVYFGGKYLGFYWYFVQHIYTHSKGFLVSLLMVYLENLQFQIRGENVDRIVKKLVNPNFRGLEKIVRYFPETM
jgi:hypothetical protein